MVMVSIITLSKTLFSLVRAWFRGFVGQAWAMWGQGSMGQGQGIMGKGGGGGGVLPLTYIVGLVGNAVVGPSRNFLYI